MRQSPTRRSGAGSPGSVASYWEAVRPVPVDFHIGSLQVHTYGIGLALAFWFGYRYLARRLRQAGYPDEWLGGTFVWIVVTAIVGARAVHVAAHLSYYSSNPLEVLAVWHGGLSSFGGLALAIPTGLGSARRRCPQLRLGVAGDLVAPVLVAAWAVGRLLGPQFMVAGGGKPTSAWFGMYYAGEVGKRLPVPLFQGAECIAVYLITMACERRLRQRFGAPQHAPMALDTATPGGTTAAAADVGEPEIAADAALGPSPPVVTVAAGALPVGVVTGIAVGLWGLSRFFDEYFWLTHDAGTDGVEIAGLAMFVVGIGAALWIFATRRDAARPAGLSGLTGSSATTEVRA